MHHKRLLPGSTSGACHSNFARRRGYFQVMRLAWVAAVVVLALAVAAPAGAASNLWATVNVCDTPAHPGQVGLRASMPGKPRGTRGGCGSGCSTGTATAGAT